MLFSAILFLFFIAFISIERVHETFFSSRYKRKKKGKVIAKWTIVFMTIFHVLVVLGTTIEYYIIKRCSVNYIISIIGLFMYFVALGVRTRCINILGEYYSINIEIRSGQALVKKGPYRFMRHPIYAVTILEVLGIPLVGNAYFSFLIALLCYLPILIIRTYLEEKELIKHYGDEYVRYQREVMAFLPFKKAY